MKKRRRRDIALHPLEMHRVLTSVINKDEELMATLEARRKAHPPPDIPDGYPKEFLDALIWPGICAVPVWEEGRWRFTPFYNGAGYKHKDKDEFIRVDSYEEAMDGVRRHLAFLKASDRTPDWNKWGPIVRRDQIALEPWKLVALMLNIDPDKVLRNLDETFDEGDEFHSRLGQVMEAIEKGELKAEMRIEA